MASFERAERGRELVARVEQRVLGVDHLERRGAAEGVGLDGDAVLLLARSGGAGRG